MQLQNKHNLQQSAIESQKIVKQFCILNTNSSNKLKKQTPL